jgi:ribonuclease HII
MRRLALDFPEYGFDVHKGYGTPEHIAAIRRFGISDIHRKSFLSTLASTPVAG